MAMSSVSRRGRLAVLVGVVASVLGNTLAVRLLSSTQDLPPQTGLTVATAQAEQGQAFYARDCASCHGEALDGGGFGPPLRGPDFRSRWGARSIGDLFEYVRDRMPPGRPRSLSTETYTGLLAFILQRNGLPAGPRELSLDPATLRAVLLPGVSAGGRHTGAEATDVVSAPARPNPNWSPQPVFRPSHSRPLF